MNTPLNLSALKSRLDKIKEEADTSITSKAVNPTSLSTFLAIYNKAGKEGYINYMEGAKILAKYLAPIDLEDTSIPDNITNYPAIPAIFHDYEIEKLAEVLITKEQYPDLYQRLAKQKHIQKTIIYLTCKQYLAAS